MNKPAAIYAARVSSRIARRENHTIASQTAALIEYLPAGSFGYTVPAE